MEMRGRRLQAATEYLATYGWAFMIIAGLSVAVYYFINLPLNQQPTNQCTFQTNVYCKSFGLTTNAIGTRASALLINSQQYLVLNPKARVSMVGYGSAVAVCTPSTAYPGNSIICNATFSTIPIGSDVSGVVYLNYTVCPSQMPSNCQPSQFQNYIGNFTTRVTIGS